ncbi:multicopy suppressor of BFA (Brefeldin A) [Malassezia vespertilionis]|uniref:multicopy suppressor of BFA (Brefeldin A) n=1 Tax=Malassezia vespertilionis TaxID=2020962 RepID=UPI0024B0F418|nr:multicopy suppressor of BFA (Brefeldin A) [Malassezia vespertilionis]WFD08533.1 multicopy suppressor of BFA (Brefeldin A) [Malassezia vespertilionis]
MATQIMPTAETTEEQPQVTIVKLPGGKPDQKHHNAEIEKTKAEIDKVRQKLTNVRAALNGEGLADMPAGKRRAELRAELDGLRSQQAGSKGSRGKVFDEIKTLQDEIAAKVKALQAAKTKAPYKSTSELDAHVAQIEAQIEAGSMKIVEERKALNEISALKRARKPMEQLGEQQVQIDKLRTQAEQLRGTLNDPESQALNKRYDEIKQELDALSKEQEKTVGSRSKLLARRTALSKELDDLHQARRDRLTAYHAENDKYYAKMTAERERRQDQYKREREEAEKLKQDHEEVQMREDAALPAFAKEIEDCEVLIRYFGGNMEAPSDAPVAPLRSANIPGVAQPRTTETEVPEGAVIVKKDEEDYFAGTKKKAGKNKKNKGAKQSEGADEAGTLQVPFGMLSALLTLSIPPPMNHADLPRVVDNVRLKREYFVSNQERFTKENMEKAEKRIAELKAMRAA